MKKILVVDDEHDICDFLQSFFQERGYAVRFATSGDSALAMVKEEKPDLMLLDVKMQGMDGIAVLKHVKDIDKQIKVVMVTALEDQDRIDEACRLGASEYITKPLVLENLERAVENNLK